jgi:hypothetical protein
MTLDQIKTATSVAERLPITQQMHRAGVRQKLNASFVDYYTNWSMGWSLSQAFAGARRPFPIVLRGQDQWIMRAYMHGLGHYDPVIQEAWALHMEPKLKSTADTLRACLIAKDFDLNVMLECTGLKADVVHAFEKLFFNVLDRKKDALYIRNMAYSKTKLVEMFENYVSNEDAGQLLIRAGFNSGMAAALELSGLSGRSAKQQAASAPQLAEQLEVIMFATAIQSFYAGFGSQADHAVAIERAKSLITAAKAGGVDNATGSPVATSDLGDDLITQMASFHVRDKNERTAARATKFIDAEII